MTDDTHAVTQADRDAAADYLRQAPMANTLLCVRVREGSEDHPLVQAFARRAEQARLASTRPMTEDVAGLVEDETFCAKVWEALKGDHNDLRKQAIILRAHRDALNYNSPESRDAD